MSSGIPRPRSCCDQGYRCRRLAPCSAMRRWRRQPTMPRLISRSSRQWPDRGRRCRMLMQAVDTSLALRRAAGCAAPHRRLSPPVRPLCGQRGETHVVTSTAIVGDPEPVGTPTPLPAANGETLCALHARRGSARGATNEHLPWETSAPRPYIFGEDELQQLLVHASRLGRQLFTAPDLQYPLRAVGRHWHAERRSPGTASYGCDRRRLLIRHTSSRKAACCPWRTRPVPPSTAISGNRRVVGLDPHLFVTRRGPLSRTVVADVSPRPHGRRDSSDTRAPTPPPHRSPAYLCRPRS